MPPALQQATTDHASARDSWTLLGKSGSVPCGVTAPFSWVLVHKVLLCPPRVCFPVLCKFWRLYDGLMATSSKRACARPRSAAPRAPAPAGAHCQPGPPQETLAHSSVSVSVGPWVLVHTGFVWALWASLVGMGFDSKHSFTPCFCLAAPSPPPLDVGHLFTAAAAPTVLLGLIVYSSVLLSDFTLLYSWSPELSHLA